MEFFKTISPHQRQIGNFECHLAAAAMATGREELLPQSTQVPMNWIITMYESTTGIFHHWAVRTNRLDWLDQAQEKIPFSHSVITQPGLLSLLERGKFAELDSFVKERVKPILFEANRKWQRGFYVFLGILAEARQMALFEQCMQFCAPHFFDLMQSIAVVLRARVLLEDGDPGAAATMYNRIKQECATFPAVLVHQALFVSLGLGSSPSREEILAAAEHYLAGVELDLVQMFFELKEPRPGKVWPHPKWRTEWRLELGLWLEARGDKAGAKEVVSPAIDPRYKYTNSQIGLRTLLARL
jgi:hypothetical protein